MSDYPEHDKLSKVKDKTLAIGEFLEWLGYEKGIQLGEWDDDTDQMWPTGHDRMDLLAEWADIDRTRLEAEKRQMLEQLRAADER